MNELDKYFEKARNVEPEYDEDDTRKFLAGKLSDGGIATNLYNKIKVYPMLTALITSVATIATIALLSISSPEIKTEKTNSPEYTTSSIMETASNDKEPIEPTDDLLSAVVEETDEAPKVDKTVSDPLQKWTDDSSIDVKAVNSLKLTKDELAELGIEIDRKSFKVNAFDKYKYIIYKNNDKQRDYYNKDEDQDAMPTPAMVTTGSGFKTLTLFKKGNVETTVDRKRTISDDGKSAQQTISVSKFETDELFKNAPRFDMSKQSYSAYKNSLSGHKDSAEIMKKLESLESLDFTMNGQTMSLDFQKLIGNGNYENEVLDDLKLADFLNMDPNKSNGVKNIEIDIKHSNDEWEDEQILHITKENIIDLDTSFSEYSSENSNGLDIVSNENFNSIIDTVGENDYVIKSDSPVKIFIHNNNHNMKVIDKENYKIVGNDTIYEKEWTTVDMDNPNPPTSEELRKAGVKTYHIENVEFVTINNVTMQDSNIVEIKERKKATDNESRKVNVYSTDLERKDIDKIIQATLDSLPNKNTTLIEVDATEESLSNDPNNKTIYMPMESLGEGKKIVINKIEANTEIKVDEDEATQKLWEEDNPDGTNKMFYSNMKFDFIDYNINELIPIEISFDGENTDFIVWYEAKEDFLKKLPINLLEKINPELAAISDQAQHCDNAPIKKDDAVMDVWSGCSGAIKGMKVFPNPATSSSKVEFSLEDNRQVSIAIYDLSGKLIKRVKNGMSLGKGQVTESLNLNDVNPGMYYVVVKSDIGEQALQRIIIQ